MPVQAFAAATFGEEFTGLEPDEPEDPDELDPEPEPPPPPPSPPPLAGGEPPAPPGLSVLAAGFASPPSGLGLLDEYRSAYQPPPLRTKLVRLSFRESVPWAPQRGQVSGAGSLTFWSASEVWWHWLHSYS
jgi:hypothetical protein